MKKRLSDEEVEAIKKQKKAQNLGWAFCSQCRHDSKHLQRFQNEFICDDCFAEISKN